MAFGYIATRLFSFHHTPYGAAFTTYGTFFLFATKEFEHPLFLQLNQFTIKAE